MKFIDANIIVRSFYPNNQQRSCEEILHDGGVINTIVLVEAFNILEYQLGREKARIATRSLYKSPLLIVDVDKNLIFEALRKSEKETNLRFADLLHYTTAVLYSCSAILTYDKDFDNLTIPREEPK